MFLTSLALCYSQEGCCCREQQCNSSCAAAHVGNNPVCAACRQAAGAMTATPSTGSASEARRMRCEWEVTVAAAVVLQQPVCSCGAGCACVPSISGAQHLTAKHLPIDGCTTMPLLHKHSRYTAAVETGCSVLWRAKLQQGREVCLCTRQFPAYPDATNRETARKSAACSARGRLLPPGLEWGLSGNLASGVRAHQMRPHTDTLKQGLKLRLSSRAPQSHIKSTRLWCVRMGALRARRLPWPTQPAALSAWLCLSKQGGVLTSRSWKTDEGCYSSRG